MCFVNLIKAINLALQNVYLVSCPNLRKPTAQNFPKCEFSVTRIFSYSRIFYAALA